MTDYYTDSKAEAETGSKELRSGTESKWTSARRSASERIGRPTLVWIVYLVVAILVVPILMTFISSFASTATGVLPRGFVTFEHWRHVLGFGDYGVRANAIPGLTFSVLVATGGMILNVIIGIPIAYALSRYDFAAHNWVNTLAILPIVPGVILGIAFLRTYPDYRGSALVLIVGYCLLKSPYMVLTVQSSFQSIDIVKLEESARSLGASWPRAFLTIIVPHAKRGILAGCIITWTLAAAEFNFTYMVHTGDPEPFSMFLFRNISNAPYLQSAAAISIYFSIVVCAILILQLLGNRGFTTLNDDR
ncbi:ABC transporter permease subunit [Salinadaptatus halalkaliphilus]|uniref:ABC transporter permease subunit n=1 Tax=Salinadaptatus halalkaliphilus TaxID=2419781 RepID=A0A4S3TM82_9EURY|nr:ABC transporter permease subunit [Salinadaptatus halalkaliphilus]THE64720.1 ABC transporter permease subunit [Salinadaptatus halalkaliphilus]